MHVSYMVLLIGVCEKIPASSEGIPAGRTYLNNMIGCWLFNVQRKIFHAYSLISKNYTKMRAEWNNGGNDFFTATVATTMRLLFF